MMPVRPLIALLWLVVCATGLAQPLTVMTWNLKGNSATNWTTNEPQVQAIGRVLQHLQPDVVTFNEVPFPHTNQMPGIVAAYLPGYSLAISSGTDGFIVSAIASRYPITRAQKWLDGASLTNFGYAGSFTRDLFEAEVNVPFYVQPLHVFTTHLKASGTSNDFAKRGAESLAISNFLATNFLPTKSARPYLLTGDMNEDATNSSSLSADPISNLVNLATGLKLTSPQNPFTLSVRTWSIQAASPTVRFDYVLPCALLFSNINASQVFRSDKLVPPFPPNLSSNDSATASDHMPVLVAFNNPYATPFFLTSLSMTGQTFRLAWRATPGQTFYLQASTNLSNWILVATNVAKNTINYTSAAASPAAARYFRVTK